jgi:hypothetical protein
MANLVLLIALGVDFAVANAEGQVCRHAFQTLF